MMDVDEARQSHMNAVRVERAAAVEHDARMLRRNFAKFTDDYAFYETECIAAEIALDEARDNVTRARWVYQDAKEKGQA